MIRTHRSEPMKSPSSSPNKPGAADPKFLKIVYRLIRELKTNPINPRLHSQKQIRQIANSVRTFGFNVPVLIDRDNNVIAGHGRLLACAELGWTEVPTLCLDHLTPTQARAFMIADNRLTEIGTWDDRLLAQQFKELSLLGLDFNIEVTGFEMGEIDLRIASLEELSETDADPADVLSEVPAGPRSARSAMRGSSAAIVSCAAMPAMPRPSRCCWARNVPQWCSPTRPTMCRSMVTRVASARSIIAPFRWRRARWTGTNTPPFSARLSEISLHSAVTAPCTSSAWTGATSKS